MNIFFAFILFVASQLGFTMHEPNNATELASILNLNEEDSQDLVEAVKTIFGDDTRELFSLFAHITEEYSVVKIRELVSKRVQEQNSLALNNNFTLLSACTFIEAALKDYKNMNPK